MLLLAWQRAARRSQARAVGYALLTGVLIAAYTVVDALGGRSAGSALGFAVCVTLGDGVATALVVWLWKGRHALHVDGSRARTVRVRPPRCRWAPTGSSSGRWPVRRWLPSPPLRESSVLFVALISALLIKERMGARRISAAVLVFVGIGLMRLGF